MGKIAWLSYFDPSTPPLLAYTFDFNSMNAEQTTILGQCSYGARFAADPPKSFANDFRYRVLQILGLAVLELNAQIISHHNDYLAVIFTYEAECWPQHSPALKMRLSVSQ